jgi:cytochrome c-type biogenesis protein CcmH/NrfG
MTAEAKQAFVRALLRDATEPRAAWFMAMSAVQDGKLIAAIGILKQAAAAQPETSVWRQRLSVQAVRIQEQLKVLP